MFVGHLLFEWNLNNKYEHILVMREGIEADDIYNFFPYFTRRTKRLCVCLYPYYKSN